MKKIKIIDLLNMISKGEEVPKKIKYNGTIYEKFDYNNKYYDVENNTREKDILSEHLASESFYNDEVEIIEEEKELHANNVEFNINNDKRDCIITLDENDLGIDKLHLDNCYFYKENDKWYVKHINLKPIAYISQEHKIPEKINWKEKESMAGDLKKDKQIEVIARRTEHLKKSINEIIDYLEVNNDGKR